MCFIPSESCWSQMSRLTWAWDPAQGFVRFHERCQLDSALFGASGFLVVIGIDPWSWKTQAPHFSLLLDEAVSCTKGPRSPTPPGSGTSLITIWSVCWESFWLTDCLFLGLYNAIRGVTSPSPITCLLTRNKSKMPGEASACGHLVLSSGAWI